MTELCPSRVYWWDGEYEGDCALPLDHDGYHYDGSSWWDDDGEVVERMNPRRYAVIPSNGRGCLAEAQAAIAPQVDRVIIIRTQGSASLGTFVEMTHFIEKTTILSVLNPAVNISRWWNYGLDFVADTIPKQDPGPTKWDVAVINDDVIVPEGWFDAVSGSMRQLGVAAGCSGGAGGMPVLHTQPGPVSLHTRMQGFAFILAGERGLRADEQFRWYCGDDDLGWRAAAAGGMVMIPGREVNHLYPNGQVTPEMQVLIAEDMQRFVDKWGQRPW